MKRCWWLKDVPRMNRFWERSGSEPRSRINFSTFPKRRKGAFSNVKYILELIWIRIWIQDKFFQFSSKGKEGVLGIKYDNPKSSGRNTQKIACYNRVWNRVSHRVQCSWSTASAVWMRLAALKPSAVTVTLRMSSGHHPLRRYAGDNNIGNNDRLQQGLTDHSGILARTERRTAHYDCHSAIEQQQFFVLITLWRLSVLGLLEKVVFPWSVAAAQLQAEIQSFTGQSPLLNDQSWTLTVFRSSETTIATLWAQHVQAVLYGFCKECPLCGRIVVL